MNFLKSFRRVACIVTGVTRLHGHFYILCARHPISLNSIRVYEDTPPFDLLMVIQLEEVDIGRRLASDSALNCLYILDSDISCIWKLTIEDNKLTKWLCDLIQPISLTISTDGQLVVLRNGRNSSELDIYEPNGNLTRTIVVSKNIGFPFRFLQIGIDTFIVVNVYNEIGKTFNRVTAITTGFSLVSSNGEIITHINLTENFNQSDDCWLWKVDGSALEFTVDFIYNLCDCYVLLEENILPMNFCF